MYPFNIVTYALFIFFVVIYFAYNGVINELDELRELTKWSWLVWTLYYGYMATCSDRFKHATLVASMFVASMGLIVMIGVSILFFLHASVILNGISIIGIGGVYVINFGQHFLPPIVYLFYTYYYARIFGGYDNVVYRNCMISAIILVCSYVMLYILYMNVDLVYGVSISLYCFVWALPLISFIGIGIFSYTTNRFNKTE